MLVYDTNTDSYSFKVAFQGTSDQFDAITKVRGFAYKYSNLINVFTIFFLTESGVLSYEGIIQSKKQTANRDEYSYERSGKRRALGGNLGNSPFEIPTDLLLADFDLVYLENYFQV